MKMGMRGNGVALAASGLILLLLIAGLVLCIVQGTAESVANSLTENKGRGADMEITASKSNFEAEVLKSETPTLVDFWAPWCGPCRLLAPVLSEVAGAWSGKLKVCKVNVDDEPELAARYGINGIPFLMLFRDGEVVGTTMGVQSRSELEAFLDAKLR